MATKAEQQKYETERQHPSAASKKSAKKTAKKSAKKTADAAATRAKKSKQEHRVKRDAPLNRREEASKGSPDNAARKAAAKRIRTRGKS
jgi:hypothetical protein